MSTTGRARRRLHERLAQVLGPEEAETLLDEMGSHDHQLSSLRDEVRIGFSKVATDIAEVRTDMADLRAELKGDMAGLRADVKTEIAGVRTEVAGLRGDFSLDIAKQTRQLGLWMVGSQLSLAAIILAATQL